MKRDYEHLKRQYDDLVERNLELSMALEDNEATIKALKDKVRELKKQVKKNADTSIGFISKPNEAVVLANQIAANQMRLLFWRIR